MALSSLAKLQIVRTLLFLFCVVDLSTSTLLFIRIGDGSPSEKILTQVHQFNFGVSSFDLWLVSILRACIFCSLTLALCFNKVVALRRIRFLSPICTIILAVLFCYIVAKLLVSFEFYADGSPVHGHGQTNGTSKSQVQPCSLQNSNHEMNLQAAKARPHPYHPWLWVLLGWTALCVAVYGGFYVTLSSLKLTTTSKKSCEGGKNNQPADETTPLLNHASLETSTDQQQGTKDTTNEKKKGQSSLAIMWRLLSYCKPDAHLYSMALVFLCISASAMAFIPYYTGQVINHIAISPSTSDFERSILIMSVITIISAVSAGLRGGIFTIANARLNLRIRNKLFRSLGNQEIAFFDEVETGEITSRLTSDTTQISDQIALNLNIFLRNMVQSIGSIIFMVQLTWKLSTITMVGIPLITIVTWYFGEHFKNISKDIQDSFAKANNVAEETFSSMKTVRSFANEEAEAANYAARLATTFHHFIKKSLVYGSWVWCNNFLELLLQVITLYYGGHLVMYHELTGGELVSLLLYQVSLGAAIDAMGSVVAGLMQAVGAAEKVFELIDRTPKIDHKKGDCSPPNLEGRVEFRNVKFSYPTRRDTQVLKGVSFTAQPGEIVALVGSSGGGKSSCISLLERFYEPDSGEVLIDGQPLSVYDHSYLHNKVALVGQEPVLYARSITDNIAYGMGEVNSETIQEAATLANAHGFISNMTDGYQTQAGEKGAHLSGGQKQRIAIARALIRKPVVLLLDEATSALDAESEHLVQQALNKNLCGRTVIVIAHRLTTIENADRIVVINKGEVMETGTHQELLKKNGTYAKLVMKQIVSEQNSSSGKQESE